MPLFLGSKIKAVTAVIASVAAAYWNSLPEVLQGAGAAAMLLVVVDTILGILLAVCTGTYSTQGISKFFKKVIVYSCVCVAAYALDLIFRAQAFAQTVVVLMIVTTELSGIMDKSEKLGFHWPVVIRERLSKLLKSVGGCDEDEPEKPCPLNPEVGGDPKEPDPPSTPTNGADGIV